MHAIVLVGGFGTRLRPLTWSVPKPMLPVGHVPIIERLIANLAQGGVNNVTLALGFKPEPFMQAFPDGVCAGAALAYAVEPEPLDTAGAIRFAARQAGIRDTFVVANGDVLTDLDIAALARFHRQHRAEATLHLTPVPDPSAFGVVATDAAGRVERFIEKPPPGTAPSNQISAGTYVFEPSVLDRIEAGRKVSVEREIFPQIVADGGLWAMPTNDYWIDTGQPDLYLKANLDAINGRRAARHRAQAVAPGMLLDPSVKARNSVIAEEVKVANGARIVDSVLLSGAVIGAGAQLTRSIVMGRVGPGASLTDCVVGSTGVIEANATLVGQRIPAPEV